MLSKILLNVGFGNSVVRDEIVAIIQPNSAPIKKFVKQKKEETMVIDATMGKKLKAVIILKSGYVLLSAISQNALVSRMEEDV